MFKCRLFNYFIVQRFVDQPTSFNPVKNYANLVSADTYLIGCAGAYYGTTPQKTFATITCNYGPGMGTTGSLYKIGEAGTACPAGTTKEAATGLCA